MAWSNSGPDIAQEIISKMEVRTKEIISNIAGRNKSFIKRRLSTLKDRVKVQNEKSRESGGEANFQEKTMANKFNIIDKGYQIPAIDKYKNNSVKTKQTKPTF